MVVKHFQTWVEWVLTGRLMFHYYNDYCTTQHGAQRFFVCYRIYSFFWFFVFVLIKFYSFLFFNKFLKFCNWINFLHLFILIHRFDRYIILMFILRLFTEHYSLLCHMKITLTLPLDGGSNVFCCCCGCCETSK